MRELRILNPSALKGISSPRARFPEEHVILNNSLMPKQTAQMREEVRNALVSLSKLPSHGSGLHNLHIDSYAERHEFLEASNGAEAFVKWLTYMLCVSRFTIYDALQNGKPSEKMIYAGKELNARSEACLAYIVSRSGHEGRFTISEGLTRLNNYWWTRRGTMTDPYVFPRLEFVCIYIKGLAHEWEGPLNLPDKLRRTYVNKAVTRAEYVPKMLTYNLYQHFVNEQTRDYIMYGRR